MQHSHSPDPPHLLRVSPPPYRVISAMWATWGFKMLLPWRGGLVWQVNLQKWQPRSGWDDSASSRSRVVTVPLTERLFSVRAGCATTPAAVPCAMLLLEVGSSLCDCSYTGRFLIVHKHELCSWLLLKAVPPGPSGWFEGVTCLNQLHPWAVVIQVTSPSQSAAFIKAVTVGLVIKSKSPEIRLMIAESAPEKTFRKSRASLTLIFLNFGLNPTALSV